MDKEAAILQGGFLSANKLCHPSSLSAIQKGDWERVGQPILDAVGELCKQVECNGGPASSAIHSKTNIVAVLWCKLLSIESGEDVETAWRENPFFAIQNGLPEINRVVLLELVKATAAAGIFGQLLLRLSESQICSELSWLAEYVVCSPTSEGDVSLLLDVWWELWRGGGPGEPGGMGSPEDIFANEFARLTNQPSPENSGNSHQAAKRFKLDTSVPLKHPPSLPMSLSPPPTDFLYILLHTLCDIRDCIATADLSQQALAVALDAVYTSFLLDRVVILTTEEKLHFLTKVVSLKEKEDTWGLAQLREAQLDLHTCSRPAKFRPNITTLPHALVIISELIRCLQQKGLLKGNDSSNPSYSTFRLMQSLQRSLVVLENSTVYQSMSGADQQTLKDIVTLIRGVQEESLPSPAIHCSPEAYARLTMTVIDHRLEEHLDFAALFARKTNWATSGSDWTECLERNQAAFQKKDTVVALATTLMSICDREKVDVSHCKKLSKIIANIFLELPLGDKNEVLASMLSLSSKGLFGGEPPLALAEGFNQELNMAFNCIIQGGGGDMVGTRAGSPGNLSTATSLVARVAFQNPEATLQRCCTAAIFNKGVFTLMAEILLQLPGLRGRGITEESLLCCCLQKAISKKALLANEQDQFLRFLTLLMQPVTEDYCGVEGDQGQWCFLSPADVVRAFVLPHISSLGGGPISMELAVQILHSALCVEVQQTVSSPHWVLQCSPFPLLYILAQHLNQASRCWEPPEVGATCLSLDTKELLVWVLGTLGQAVGQVVASEPSSWSRALSWLYGKVEELDWTVRFHLKPVWGEHFKNEVPSSLLVVCDLAEQEWSGLELPQYGQGSGLLAWMECCCISDSLRSSMLSHLCLDRHQPNHVNMFSKGLLVALAQTLPWCSLSEWRRLLGALRELLDSGLLHTPYSLEYVDYLPLLDLRRFSSQLRLSVLLLRALQFLCGSSCDGWLPAQGWAHVGRLYAYAIRETLEVLRTKLAPSSSSSCSSADPTSGSPKPPKNKPRNQSGEVQQRKVTSPEKSPFSPHPKSTKCPQPPPAAPTEEEPGGVGDLSAEVLFVLGQLFCHVQHVQVMMPGGRCEALFLCALEILSLHESITATYPDSSTHLESANTRHFFTTITDNLESVEMKAVLQQKIAKLSSSMA